jgi:hypothetical protein
MLRAVPLLAGALLAAGGCSDDDSSLPDGPTHTPGEPGAGAHSLSFYRLHAESSQPTIRTREMATAPAGSTIIVSVGRGTLGAHVQPSDNKGNPPYPQLGQSHSYSRWPSSGTALYASTAMIGGDGHVVSVARPSADEVTLAAVEVLEGTRVQAFEWNEAPAADQVTSRSVITTGPATLVAFWWGDADITGDKKAVPNNGFTVVDSVLEEGALVQAAVAVKSVSEAGTYDVTWTAMPRQGAQLWLVAVQK